MQPATVLGRHRRLVARRWTEPARRKPGRPSTERELHQLVLRLDSENPTWGYRRVHGELHRLGHKIAASTVWTILRDAGREPTPEGAGNASVLVRAVSDGRIRGLHGGGGQYTRAFDDVFSAIGAEAITTTPGARRANAHADRWVRSVRRELLDRTIIWNERQLRALLEEYVAHRNEHRPHRSLGQRAPTAEDVAVIGSA